MIHFASKNERLSNTSLTNIAAKKKTTFNHWW